MMQDLICYKKMPEWNKDSLPKMFQEKHNTKEGTWAKVTVLQGKLKFYVLDETGNVLSEHIFDKGNPAPFVEPQVWHRVEALSDDLICYLEFYCTKEDYFAKKYNLTKTHSEILNAVKEIKPCKALDLGCGRGRNSLFLKLLGFDVTSLELNPDSLAFLNSIIEKENFNIKTASYDINSANITENYDFIFSTVVFMFLNPEAIPRIIKNMQEHTLPGGYNLIVSAMSTEDYPCPVPFSFTFKEQELKEYYKDWDFIKYNEELGELHKTDANGNRIKMKFVTMLAKKR